PEFAAPRQSDGNQRRHHRKGPRHRPRKRTAQQGVRDAPQQPSRSSRSRDQKEQSRRETVVVTPARFGGQVDGAQGPSRGSSSHDPSDSTWFAGAPARGCVSYIRTATMAAPTAVTPATAQIAATNPKRSAMTPDSSAPATNPASRQSR